MISEQITDILRPHLDANRSISIARAEEILRENESIDLDELNPEHENLGLVLSDQEEAFGVDNNENPTLIVCKLVPPPLPPVNTDELNRKIQKVVKELISINKKNGKNFVLLTQLGQKLGEEGIKLPDGEKLKGYLGKFPELFQINGENGVDHVVLTKGPVPPPPPEGNNRGAHGVSPYNLFDFATFENYPDAKRTLAELAREEGWFVLPDKNDKDAYALLDFKLRTQFASLAKALIEGQDADVTLKLNQASFNTGFVTRGQGQPIYAHFVLNQLRDDKHWQAYKFDSFRTHENS